MWASFTSGTLHFLEQLINKHSKHDFYLMKNPHSIVIYYEHDKKKSIFVSGKTFSILHKFNGLQKKGIVTLEHVPVTNDGAAIFEERFKNIAPVLEKRDGIQAIRLLKSRKKLEYVILSHWKTERYKEQWEQSPDFEQYNVRQFARLSAYFAERPFKNSYTMIAENDETE